MAVWWGFLVLDLKGLWIIVLLKPAVCVHWVLTLPQHALFGCPRVTLCRVTKKCSVCFRHLLPSFFNCEASHLLIKYQVPLNTVTIASDKNVANHLYCANNNLHECEKQIFKIEVLTPIYCCSLKSDVWSSIMFIQKVFPNLNSLISELLFKLWAWIEQLCKRWWLHSSFQCYFPHRMWKHLQRLSISFQALCTSPTGTIKRVSLIIKIILLTHLISLVKDETICK